MPHVQTVLCPVDFSEPSRRALGWAAAIARRRRASLTVLSVLEPLLTRAAHLRLGIERPDQDTERALRTFVEATVPADTLDRADLHVDLSEGEPAEAIVGASRRRDAGVVVMGTHGRGWLGARLLGSTTEHVLRQSDVPVLVVPRAAGEVLDALRPCVQVRRIVVATDVRQSALEATQWASGLPREIDVPLTLVHVVEPVTAPRRWRHLAAELEGNRVESRQRMLSTLVAAMARPDVRSVVAIGARDDTIAAFAMEDGAGLVVFGVAEAGESARRRAGAAALRVLRIAGIPVAVVPGPVAFRNASADQPWIGSARAQPKA